jgi:hypothetical protein
MDWPFWPPSMANAREQRTVGPEQRTVGAVSLAATSPLFSELCRPDGAGTCRFASEATLRANLVCDGAECDLDTVRVVQLDTPTETVYFEYVPAPCVEHAFFEGGKFAKASGDVPYWSKLQCFDPRVAAAGATCVNPEDVSNSGYSAIGMETCNYSREKVKFATADVRCRATARHERNLFHEVGGAAAAELGYTGTPVPTDYRLQHYAEEADTEFGLAAKGVGDQEAACVGTSALLEVRCCSGNLLITKHTKLFIAVKRYFVE